MKVGPNISEMQKDLLERAKVTRSFGELIHIFQSLIENDDMRHLQNF